MKTALTIAGSDSGGGAGIQADIKTMTVNGVYAMSVITALTAQNTIGVQGIMEVTPSFLKQQMDAVFTDIVPDAVKIGMVSTGILADTIAERLTFYQAKNIVIDPVMVSTSGSKLLEDSAIGELKNKLLPLGDLVTPNIPEAEVLANRKIKNEKDMEEAARSIYELYGCRVLCKGGHNFSEANDVLCDERGLHWFQGLRIKNSNTHGTGCTLSSAIAANLAKGNSMVHSIEMAKEYLSGALAAMLDLGKGSGPLHHAYKMER